MKSPRHTNYVPCPPLLMYSVLAIDGNDRSTVIQSRDYADDEMTQRVETLRGYIIVEALQHRDKDTYFKIDEHGELAVSHPDEIEYIPMWIPGFSLCHIVSGRLLDCRNNDQRE